MVRRFLIILSVLSTAGSAAFFADMFKKMSSQVADIADKRPNVEVDLDAMTIGDDAEEPLPAAVPIKRLEEKPGRPKWLTPFSKTLTVGRIPVARVSTDWTDVRRAYHVKGRAPESAMPGGEKARVSAPAREIADDDATVWPIWWRAWEDNGPSGRRKR